MANVNKVALCPRCKVEISFPLPKRCPDCSLEIKKASNEHFYLPDYISTQYEDFREELGAYKSEGMSDENRKEMDSVVSSLFKWCRECTAMDKLAAMSDAHLIVKHLIHSSTSPEHIKQILNVGKKIGELCVNLDDYVKKGGSFENAPVTYKEPLLSGEPKLDVDTLDLSSASR